MPLYRYRAKMGPENIIEDCIEAESQEEAIEKISRRGHLPIEIKEEEALEPKPRSTFTPTYLPKVKSHDITSFSRQLGSFIKSGMPILRGLSIISEQSRNNHLKKMFDHIRTEVKEGKPLSSALENYPQVFSPLYIAMVRTGESSGTLQEVFMRIADYRQKQEEILSRVRMALVYPALMVTVAAGTIIFMFTFVMPRMMHIFSTIGEDLPLPTKILIAISDGIAASWPGIILAIAIIFLVVKLRARARKAQALFFSRMKLALPILGNFVLRAQLAMFSRTLELLIKNGIPILEAIKTAIPTLDNEAIRQDLIRSSKELEQGASFGRSLKQSTLFPAFMSNLIIIGEESGALEEALAEIANTYEKETEEATKVMTALLEPTVILAMGLLVGFIVMAMLLPVFQMSLMVR